MDLFLKSGAKEVPVGRLTWAEWGRRNADGKSDIVYKKDFALNGKAIDDDLGESLLAE